jgi:conjugative relaxase-like TrwC/TraI family protein
MAFSHHKLVIGEGQSAGQAVNYLADTAQLGDYYSESQRAPMVWGASARARVALGLNARVELSKVEALLNGRHPISGELLRKFGPSRTMIGGIDVTLSPAPKSVSVLWAMADNDLRYKLETLVLQSASAGIAVMAQSAPLVRQRYGPGPKDVHAIKANNVVAVHALHTTARLSETRPGVADPQLHVHNVLFADLTEQGKLRAIESRAILNYQTELDARTSGGLADALQRMGFEIERKLIHGPGGHVKRVGWELKGVPESLNQAMSGRSHEIGELAKEFRAKFGRNAEGPLWERWIVQHRGAKSKLSAEELRSAWTAEGETHGFGPAEAAKLHAEAEARRASWQEPATESAEAEQFRGEILQAVCRVYAMVPLSRLHALTQQRALGLVTPTQAGHIVADLFGSGDLLLLENGMVTTLEVIAQEQRAERALHQLLDSTPSEAASPEQLDAEYRQAEDEGRPFDPEQREAIALALSGSRFVSIAGPAGTGKGYASKAMVDIWHDQGRRVFALAVAGRTAQQAGHDSGAEPMTLNQLQARTEYGSLQLKASDVLLIDEAAMIDHTRYADVLDTAAKASVTLVQVGDDQQLSPVEAGGLWTVFHGQAQQRGLAVELRTVRRARNPAEAAAWTAFREGRVHEALTWYYDQGELQLYDTREQQLAGMVADWWQRNPAGVMVLDTSNAERDSANRMAQAKRLEAGELGPEVLTLDNGHALRTGDHVLFAGEAYYLPDRPRGERVENGTSATVIDLRYSEQPAEVGPDAETPPLPEVTGPSNWAALNAEAERWLAEWDARREAGNQADAERTKATLDAARAGTVLPEVVAGATVHGEPIRTTSEVPIPTPDVAVLEVHEPGGDRLVEVDTSAKVELAYARHISKGQGMTAPTADVAISEQTSHETLYTMLSRSQDGTRIHALRAEVQEMDVNVPELENAERTQVRAVEPEALEMDQPAPGPDAASLRMFNDVEISPGQVISFSEPLPLRQPSGVEQGELGVVRSIHQGGMTWNYANVELVGQRQVNVYQPDQVEPAPEEIKAQDVYDQVPTPEQRNPYSNSTLPLQNGAIIQRGDQIRFAEAAGPGVEAGAQGHVVAVERHAENCAYVEIEGSGQRVPVRALSNVEIVQPASTEPEAAPAEQAAAAVNPEQASIDQLSKQAERSSAKEAVNHLEAAQPAEPAAVEHQLEHENTESWVGRWDETGDRRDHEQHDPPQTQAEPEPTAEQEPTPEPQPQPRAQTPSIDQTRQQAVDRSAGREPAQQTAEQAQIEYQGVER